jgi:cysteine desulfurase
MIYLDYAASAPLRPEVARRFAELQESHWANPSSLHLAGARAREVLEEARRFLQGTLGGGRALFTSGATEGNNTVIQGLLRGGAPGRALAPATAHASILEPLALMERQGREVEHLPVDGTGRIRLEALARALAGEPRLLCLQLANNETGTVQPLGEITALVRESSPRTWIHLDAVQAYGRRRIDLEDDRVDSLVLSGHKIGAPRGIGLLACRRPDALHPLLPGGGQEEGLRGGTENPAAAAALALAGELAFREASAEEERLGSLRRRLLAGLEEAIPELRINGGEEGGLAHILNFSCPGAPGETVLHFLAEAGIMVGTGSACSGRKKGPSHVLRAMGVPDAAARSALRISFGHATREEEIDRLLAELPPIVARLRRLGVDR